jgi:hypothetical protein
MRLKLLSILLFMTNPGVPAIADDMMTCFRDHPSGSPAGSLAWIADYNDCYRPSSRRGYLYKRGNIEKLECQTKWNSWHTCWMEWKPPQGYEVCRFTFGESVVNNLHPGGHSMWMRNDYTELIGGVSVEGTYDITDHAGSTYGIAISAVEIAPNGHARGDPYCSKTAKNPEP